MNNPGKYPSYTL